MGCQQGNFEETGDAKAIKTLRILPWMTGSKYGSSCIQGIMIKRFQKQLKLTFLRENTLVTFFFFGLMRKHMICVSTLKNGTNISHLVINEHL